ncbi:hypothetical protein CONPUDRAFT_159836 [Coniophora puteana RWD-64-598 SS2]|uniref:GST N-terminal domain-containing protein n=1 Tax=Coniophora puteana (strain RWD-64-598) TaxID=741705 RepID=R7SHJ6_CONPW|nr:uncharacterized protein CONPUDRAFT_159836 [Coniophora puteana RWD-64-598 SS2]EIW74544.1 hypothetical protein CONPUDRAFT_159836 [Coniophora puteana RWD-64-598 SS2]
MKPVILYDLQSELPGKFWSPNTLKTRLALAYKRIPFETRWLELPELHTELRHINAPTNTCVNGTQGYTVPTIFDPNTGAVVTDSWTIAEYIEDTYPDADGERVLFPGESRALVKALAGAAIAATWGAQRWVVTRVAEVHSERCAAGYRRVHGQRHGLSWEEMSPEGSALREEHKAALKKGLGEIDAWYKCSKGEWLCGERFSYADIIVAAQVIRCRRVFRQEEWDEMKGWHDGRWEKMIKRVQATTDFLGTIDELVTL